MTYSVLQIGAQGYLWEIDASVIAKSRADWYGNTDPDVSWEEWYEETISDAYELSDWYWGNMNWDEIPEQNKRLVQTPPVLSSPDELRNLNYHVDFDSNAL